MVVQGKIKEVARREMTGAERLGLRVSNMINHPLAQFQRWVTIHRMDSDSEADWLEVMAVLDETDGIEMTHNAEEQSVTLRWEPSEDDERIVADVDASETEESAPF